MSLLNTSLKFLEMGLHPIPCHRPDDQTKCTCHHQHQCVSAGKHPAMPWHTLQKTGVTTKKLDAWFGEAGSFEDYNYRKLCKPLQDQVVGIIFFELLKIKKLSLVKMF
jgi:hypothetical protein